MFESVDMSPKETAQDAGADADRGQSMTCLNLTATAYECYNTLH